MTTQLLIPKERLETLSIRLNKFIVENEIPMGDELGKIVDDVFIFSGALLATYEQEPVAKVDNIGVCWFADEGMLRKPPVGTELFTHPVPSIPALPYTELPADKLEAERALFDGFMATDYSPDNSGAVELSDEQAFIEVLFHIWQARASLAVPDEMTADIAWGTMRVPAEDCRAWADGWNSRAALLNHSGDATKKVNAVMPDFEGISALTQRECYQAGLEAGIARAAGIPEGVQQALSAAVAAITEKRDSQRALFAVVKALSPTTYTLLLRNPKQALDATRTPYAVPTGYALVPIEPTEDMVVNGFECWPDKFFSEPEVWKAYQAMSGCQQAAHRAELCWAAMIAAAPKEA